MVIVICFGVLCVLNAVSGVNAYRNGWYKTACGNWCAVGVTFMPMLYYICHVL